MQYAARLGLSIALLAAAMTAPAPAHAANEPGYACDSGTLGNYEITLDIGFQGIFYTFWVCTGSGWQAYGSLFCDPFGNCSSD